MFKLFFRTITLILFVFFLTIGIAVWKGGKPFRWLGGGLVAVGQQVSNFGEFVDDVIAGGKTMRQGIERFSDTADPDTGK